LEFRLTYSGVLLGASRNDTRARHKHEIRRYFHPQLRRFWQVHPALLHAKATGVQWLHKDWDAIPSMSEDRATRFHSGSYNFVPLVLKQDMALCYLNILFLRADAPGSVIKSGDIDNRLKTLFDALRMPTDVNELGGYDAPTDDEKPFYVLLEDDNLITRISVETDGMLEAPGSGRRHDNDARLIITVNLKPYAETFGNPHSLK
jgi:hypothetical protein